jgi:hypothetical protein
MARRRGGATTAGQAGWLVPMSKGADQWGEAMAGVKQQNIDGDVEPPTKLLRGIRRFGT